MLGFMFALLILPILTYFYTLDNVFHGNSVYSAFASVAIANVVVIGYVVVAILEDAGEGEKEKTE